MLPNFTFTEHDPITGREISNRCWNGWHQAEGELIPEKCATEDCECGCHDHVKEWKLS